MKIIMYFSSGAKVIGDLLTPPSPSENGRFGVCHIG